MQRDDPSSLLWFEYFLQTAPIIPVLGEDTVQSNHQGLICVICKPIDPIPQLKMSTVTDPLAASQAHSGVPLFSDPLHRSTLHVCFLQPVTGQYSDPRAPPSFHLQSLSRQTSINGARWGDNEASRQRLTMVRNTQSSHCNTVMRDGHRRRVKRCPGLTSQRLLNEYLYLLNKGITCPDGVLANIHWEHHTHSPLWHKQPPTQRSGP